MIKSKKRLIKDILFFLALLLLHVVYIYFYSKSLGDKRIHLDKIQWKPGSPVEQGIHPHRMQRAEKYIDSRLPAARSLIIIKDGRTILEKYYWQGGPQETDYLHSMNSAVLEMLIGIAVKENILTGLSQPLADFFPAWFEQNIRLNSKTLTIESLLQVKAELLWGEETPEYWQLFYAQDKVTASLDALFSPSVNKKNQAANFAAAFLLSEIIRLASGMDIFVFADQYLFAPLEITTYKNYKVQRNRMQEFLGFKLKTLDLAKLGYLILQEGIWEDRQLVSSDWVRTRMKNGKQVGSVINQAGNWQHKILGGKHGFAAQGEGGQFIVLYPELDMVVAVNSNSRFPLPKTSGYEKLFELIARSALQEGENLENIESYDGDPTERAYYEPNFVFATHVPQELQNFFKDFARDIATKDVRMVVHHYAKGYEKDDDTFKSVYGNWYKIYGGGTGELESVQINKVRIENNRAYLRGILKYSYANMQEGIDGWFPIENLIKLRGRWQWFGSPVYASILDRDEYFDAEVDDEIATFINECAGAFIGGDRTGKSCFVDSFSYNGSDRSQFSGMVIPFLKDQVKIKLHLTRVEQSGRKRLVEGYFESNGLGEMRMPPGMQIIREKGHWKWFGNGGKI
jgi:CubicO group peptidase (beta-lactamase class C family)